MGWSGGWALCSAASSQKSPNQADRQQVSAAIHLIALVLGAYLEQQRHTHLHADAVSKVSAVMAIDAHATGGDLGFPIDRTGFGKKVHGSKALIAHHECAHAIRVGLELRIVGLA